MQSVPTIPDVGAYLLELIKREAPICVYDVAELKNGWVAVTFYNISNSPPLHAIGETRANTFAAIHAKLTRTVEGAR